ncbi:MAG TPA: hypothetical protein VE270_13155 [Thermoleophilaceae bacterium]|nr:hypothetical protein [Thermoleophilaceae bacterium]
MTEQLIRRGWEASLVSGSLHGAAQADARRFYDGLPLHTVDFRPALESADPMRFDPGPGGAPMHASFEGRKGAPDRPLAMLGRADLALQVRAWAREL